MIRRGQAPARRPTRESRWSSRRRARIRNEAMVSGWPTTAHTRCRHRTSRLPLSGLVVVVQRTTSPSASDPAKSTFGSMRFPLLMREYWSGVLRSG